MVGGGWSDDERGEISHSSSATAILKYQTPFVYNESEDEPNVY
jgi:hypothetical protein